MEAVHSLLAPPLRWYAAFTYDDWRTVAASSAVMLAFFIVVRGTVEFALAGPVPADKVEAEAARKATRKSRAWTMSLLNSCFLSCVGTYYAVQLLAAPTASFTALALSDVADGPLPSRVALLWMMAFMLNDLFVGIWAYPEYLDWLSGWLHHGVYLLILPYLATQGYSVSFAAGCFCEVPTFLLALGSVNKAWRTDLPFGVTFFFTRVAFFMWLAVQHHWVSHKPVLRNMAIACVLLHCYWLGGWLKSYRKVGAAVAAKKAQEGKSR